MSKKWTFRIVTGLLIVLVGMQFIRADRSTPITNPGIDFMQLAAPPAEIATLVKTACYDCHSYQTTYPWYSNVAPISWWIDSHVKDGRKHLNFSEWGKYPLKKRIKKAEETAEEVEEGHMPESSYTWMHGGSRLTAAQRTQLAAYFEEVEAELKSIPAMPPPLPNIPPPIQ